MQRGYYPHHKEKESRIKTVYSTNQLQFLIIWILFIGIRPNSIVNGECTPLINSLLSIKKSWKKREECSSIIELII